MKCQLSRNSRTYLYLAITASISVTQIVTRAPVAMAGEQEKNALHATVEQRFKPTQQILMESRLVINEDGVKVEPVDDSQGLTFIANAELDKIWMIDNRRALIHEVPMTSVDGAPELTEALIRLPGFIDSQPCLGQIGVLSGTVELKGRTLERWLCRSEGPNPADEDDIELPEEQYYSTEHKLVLYSKNASGLETELINPENRPMQRAEFAPPDGFRAVSIEEIMGVPMVLESYLQTSDPDSL